jgi:hypothetical protein
VGQKKRHKKKRTSILDRFRKELRNPQSEPECGCIVIVPGGPIDHLPEPVRFQVEAHFAAGAIAVLVVRPPEKDEPQRRRKGEG